MNKVQSTKFQQDLSFLSFEKSFESFWNSWTFFQETNLSSINSFQAKYFNSTVIYVLC